MDFSDFLVHTQPITLLELLAASMGTIFYLKSDRTNKSDLWLVVFLWITLVIESLGSYAPIAYFSDYKYFAFVEGTRFSKNFWMYNIFILFSYTFYGFYFRYYLKVKVTRLILGVLIGLYLITSIYVLLTSDVFFNGFSQYSMIAGAFLLFVSVVLFYYELLQSDLLLSLWKLLPFYISIGALVFHLCITPIDIFSKYFKSGFDLFVNMRAKVLLFANIFMYSVYIIGFIVCLNRKKN